MNEKSSLESIFEQFDVNGTFISCQPTGKGHINDTLYVTTDDPASPGYILQRINHQIFTNVPRLMENISRVTTHLKSKILVNNIENSGGKVLEVIKTKKGATFTQDKTGNYWRCYAYCPHAPQKEGDVLPEQAFEGGKALGRFQTLLSDLPGDPLFDIIPNFHNLAWRLDNLHKAEKADAVGRLKEVWHLVEKLHDRENEMLKVHRLGLEGKIPVRITHNDTKFNNILFDKDGKAICIIDLDTVMSGYVLNDFGDAVRTLSNTTSEDEQDVSLLKFNMELYKKFASGYFSEARHFLTETETSLLAFSCKLLTYIMAVRFMTDYLAGDVYYKISHPLQNLHRAKNQIRLIECMEEQFVTMENEIRKLVLV